MISMSVDIMLNLRGTCVRGPIQGFVLTGDYPYPAVVGHEKKQQHPY